MEGGSSYLAVNSGKNVWTKSSGKGGSYNPGNLTNPSFSSKSYSKELHSNPSPAPVVPSPGFPSPTISLGTASSSLGLTNPVEPAVVMNAAVVVEPCASVNPIPIPSFISLPNQTFRDNSLSATMTQFVTAEIKTRKSSKEKLKAMLAIIDSMDEDELGEVGSVSRPVQLPSPQENTSSVCIPTVSASSSNSFLKPSGDPSPKDCPSSPSFSEMVSSSDALDLVNFVLTWDSNDDFCNFCSKIGFSFNSWVEAGSFLNVVRSQQSLPPINLDDFADCLELFRALKFSSTV